MLPVPKNPKFRTPEVSEEEFFNPKGQEDESLLATGAWDDDIDTPTDDNKADTLRKARDEIRNLKAHVKGKK